MTNMINISYLQNWLTEIYKPCGIVYSSDLAKKSINKNNLSPADFLGPFGDFKGKKIDLSFQEKTNTPSNTVIRNFFFDFYDNTKCKTVHRKNIQNYLATMFQTNTPVWDLNSPIVTKTNQEPFINIISSYSSFSKIPGFSTSIIFSIFHDKSSFNQTQELSKTELDIFFTFVEAF